MTTATITRDVAGMFAAGHAANQTLIEPGRPGRRRATRTTVPRVPMNVGDRVKFLGDRRWFDVRATSTDHTVLTRSGNFGRDGVYTIIAWPQGRRGPHASYLHGAETDADCQAIVDAMDAGTLELSERRAIHLDLDRVAIL